MRARDHWILALILLATAAVYAQVATHDFVNFDDSIYVTQNPNFEGGLSAANLIRALTTPYAAYWIPLTWISLLIDHELYGAWAGGFLLTNLAFHLLNVALLYAFFMRATGARWPSAFVAAVFALHPLHVESVAWVTERKDVLSVFFGLLTLHAYLRWCRTSRHSAYALVLVAYGLALLAKPSLVTLPVLMLLLDLWPFDRLRARPILLEKVPLFVMATVVGIVALSTQAAMGGMELSGRISAVTKTINGFDALARYLCASIWPAGLAAIYPMPLQPPAPWIAILGAGLLVAATLTAVKQCAARPYLFVGWAWFLVTLAPVSGFLHVGVQARADRFMYVPLIGLSIAVAWGIAELASRWKLRPLLLGSLASAAVAALAVVACRQASYWYDTVALFERAIAVTRDNYYAHNRLAEQYKSELRLDEAEAEYAEAMRIYPAWITPQLQFASLREARGDARTAGLFRASALRVQAQPELAPAFVGIAWMEAGRYRWALPLLEPAAALVAESGDAEWAAEIRKRIELCRAQRPFAASGPFPLDFPAGGK